MIEESASTNGDVADRFRSGEGEGLVLAAEHQTAGRGRLGREWVTPARTSLTVSFLLVPEGVPADRWPWLPLLTGIAAAAAVRRVTGVQVALKWPNDVLADDHKLGGILLERVEHGGSAAAVVGIGINCHQSHDELPVPEATSLAIVTGGPVDRSALLTALVEELEARYDEWAAGPTCGRRTSSCAPRPDSRCRWRPGWRGGRRGGGRRRGRPARRTHLGRGGAPRRRGRCLRPPGGPDRADRPWHDRPVAISPRLLNEGEHVVLSTRTHVKALILPAVVLIVVAGLAGYLSAARRGPRGHLAVGDLGDHGR